MVTLSEFRDVGSSIFRVSAEDQDLAGEIRYGTQGVAPAPTYFGLDPETGQISVAKDLGQDRTTTYTVSGTSCSTLLFLSLLLSQTLYLQLLMCIYSFE